MINSKIDDMIDNHIFNHIDNMLDSHSASHSENLRHSDCEEWGNRTRKDEEEKGQYIVK